VVSLKSKTDGETMFRVNFEWDESQGIPGAVIVKNHQTEEVFLKTLTLEGVPGKGTVVFVANSWVYNHQRYTQDRIFFANDVSSGFLFSLFFFLMLLFPICACCCSVILLLKISDGWTLHYCRHICPAKCLPRWCLTGKMNSSFSEATITLGHTRSTTVSTATTTTTTLVTQTRAKTRHVQSLVAPQITHIPGVAEPAGPQPKPVSSSRPGTASCSSPI
jgi:hypothetical protein